MPWWQRQVAEHEDTLGAAGRLLDQARELYETGATRCEAALHTAADDSLGNHGGLFADVRRTIHHTVKRFPQIKTFAKYIGLAAGALAMTAAMFTGVGELAVAAYAVGGLATTLDTALAVSGDGRWTTAGWDAVGLLTFGAGRAFASAARGTSAVRALRETEALERGGSLKGLAAEGVRSARPLTGIAAKSRLLNLYDEWSEFTPEAARGLLPEARNWLKAATVWKEIEIPPKDLLRLSEDATRYAGISRTLEGASKANDIRGMIASENEVLEEQAE